MTAVLIVGVALAAVGCIAGWLIPAWAMKRLLPALESGGPRVTNYRGRSIPTGLGIVWLIWAVAVSACDSLVYYIILSAAPGRLDLFSAVGILQIVGIQLAVLVVGAAAFGMVDDLFGDSAAKGFRGHLTALIHGRLTTGGLKLLGIGVLAIGVGLYTVRDYTPRGGGTLAILSVLAVWACAALVIALSANFVNLADLRPGRALKAYSFLAVLGVAWVSWSLWAGGIGRMMGGDEFSLPVRLAWIACVVLSMLAFTLGPVFAIWRFDLGERAMLGDAGANAMGALAGFLLAWHAPLWLLAVFVVILLALNVASERVSFSKVIERTAFLRWLDGLGRLPSDVPGSETAPATAPGTDARGIDAGE